MPIVLPMPAAVPVTTGEQIMQTAIESMTRKISAIAGVPVELTFRAEDAVTISYDGSNDAAIRAIETAFRGRAEISHSVDAECGTCIYLDHLH